MIASSALLAVMAGTAVGQSAPGGQAQTQEGPARYSYERRLGGAQPVDSEAGRSVTNYLSKDGEHSYSVRIENGKVTRAEVDGKNIAASRVRQSKEKIEILDENGEVLHSFEVPVVAADPTEFRWRFQPDGQMRDLPAWVAGEGFKPPPVMLGITMSEPDEDVVEHLGVKSGEAIRVDTVIEGLPAAQAGLKVHDIIVSIDGQKPVNQDKLREVLRAKKPGDTIRLTVISKGKTQDIEVALEAYDPQKLGAGGVMSLELPGPGEAPFDVEGLQDLQGLFAQGWAQARPKLDEARRALERSLEQMKESGELSAESMKAKAVEALTKALRSLEEASGSAARRLEMGRPRSGGGVEQDPNEPVGRRGQPRPQVYITPMPGAQADQMERLTAALERMEQRLADLEERIERRQREAGGEGRPKR